MSPVPPASELLATLVATTGGAFREGQVAMASAVEASLSGRAHLLVQAGTGTGKSFAYLVPALACGKRVVVATATLGLQSQLVERDLPLVVDALASRLGRRPRFAILKGRRNYACLLRARGGAVGLEEPEESAALIELPSAVSALAREVQRLRAWAERTDAGDRDELSPAPSEQAWSQVAVSARECVGAARCPYGEECFAERARALARDADVVVTNHALLAIDALDAAPVLPDHDAVIVDEAHELVDRVTGAATIELSPGLVDRAAGRCRGHVGRGVADRLAEASDALATVLAAAPAGRLVALPPDLAATVRAVRDAASAAARGLGGERDRGDPAEDAARRAAVAAAEIVLEAADRMLAGSEADVAWLETDERRGPRLRVAPLSVAGLLRGALFARRRVVLTSATLTLGGSFEPIARSVGLPVDTPDRSTSTPASGRRAVTVSPSTPNSASGSAPAGGSARGSGPALDPASDSDSAVRPDPEPCLDWRGLDVGSPFDYRRQGILYVAAHLPRPGRDGLSPQALDELCELVAAAGGRTLGLFSSRRAALAAAEAVRGRLDVPVLAQGDDSLGALVRRFATDPRACLLGTLSLWQGVDVPGPACQLVVIDRIPFPRPDDPLPAARQAAVDAAGGNGFRSVAVARAALLLAQGAGRLIRTADDRGVVAILDCRAAPRRSPYANFLLRSLPPFWFTTDPAQVRRSLAAIDAAAPC